MRLLQKKILELTLKGLSVDEINKRTYIHPDNIHFWIKKCKDEGLLNNKKPTTIKQTRIRSYKRERVLKLINKGYSDHKIMENMGLSRHAFYKHQVLLRKEGLIPYLASYNHKKVLKLFKEGMKRYDIMKKLNLTSNMLRQIMYRMKKGGQI